MTTLIDKLRAAETGSPELSFEVYKEFPHLTTCKIKHGVITQSIIDFDPPLTESIYSALTLVPDRMLFIIEKEQYGGGFRVRLRRDNICTVDYFDSIGIHQSLPIAICIAVLSSK